MNRPAPESNAPPLAFVLSEAARLVAAVRGGHSLDAALDRIGRAQPDLTAGTRGAIQDFAYGTLRDYGRGDFFLAHLLKSPLAQPLAHALLLAALWRLETRPETAHTTVDQAVDAAARLDAARMQPLVNALLRNFLRRREELAAAAERDDVARHRHPAWWLARLRRDHPQRWRSIAAEGNRHPPMALRVNARRIPLSCYHARLDAEGIASRSRGEAGLLLERPVPVCRLPGFGEGLVSVQDLGAQRACALLDARDGMRVLDACAAPGGKSAHILERARVELTALDADARRCGSVRANLARLGLEARVLAADCREPDAWWDGRCFDRILLDAPCSASGVVRRHPDAKWLRRPGDIAGFARIQAQMLEALWRALAPGGKLLYATCSVFAEENEERIAAFAAGRRDCRRVAIEAAGGASAWQLFPCAEHDGFFYAVLEKRGA
ncbi:MAG: 16S rRNA (cytosine(967)-C(5))-methyltransferase RsmB [Rhodocyclaceae bacterium]